MPKGSVSRQIQALEHQLGTQLLQRTTRRVKLTPEGMTYYQRAKDVLSNLNELDGLFQQDATSISGKLRIDIPPGIAKSLLLPRLSEFLYLHPGIELELSSHDRPVDILHDGFDCVIRTGASPEDGVIARPRQTDRGQLCQSTLSDALWLSSKPRRSDFARNSALHTAPVYIR